MCRRPSGPPIGLNSWSAAVRNVPRPHEIQNKQLTVYTISERGVVFTVNGKDQKQNETSKCDNTAPQPSRHVNMIIQQVNKMYRDFCYVI